MGVSNFRMGERVGLLFVIVLLCVLSSVCGGGFQPLENHVVETSKGVQQVTWSEWKELLARQEGGFDRSYLPDQKMTQFAGSQPSIPTNCTREQEVNGLISLLSIDEVESQLSTLTSFYNRFYTSKPGISSAEWIYSQYQTLISKYPSDEVRKGVKFFNHTWPQPSVIATIEGIGPNKAEKVIIGAHLDSVNWVASNQDLSRAPGACDDGSGTVTVMEVFRVMAESGIALNRTVEFHHYAAEEVGLLGSQDIANAYATQGELVAGYLNFDMDGYPDTTMKFNIISDYTDADLNAFLVQLIESYSSIGYTQSNCNYPCSDHASWNNANYRASFPIENGPYPNTHTANDKEEYLFLPYLMEFCQVGVGFLVEIGAWGER